MSRLTESPQWQALQAHRAAMAGTHVRELFTADPRRFENFAIEAGPLTLDFSRHRASVETRDLLLSLANACEVDAWREKMFAGAPINTTEHRAVLHVALRGSGAADGEAALVRSQAREVLDRMGAIARAVRTGLWRGATGQVITDVIHIGIGGSDFGPRLLVDALRAGRPGPRVHFVANVDPDDLADAIAACNPESTLVVVISKTFTTIETLTNAQAARDWLAEALGPALESHLVAVSNNVAAASAFGIAGINILLWPNRSVAAIRYGPRSGCR